MTVVGVCMYICEELELLGQHRDQTSQFWRKSTLNTHWKNWCWSWSSNTAATWCEESTHWKRPWCWERLKAKGEEGSRGWDAWMASPTQWTWSWTNSEIVRDREALHAAVHGLQRVGHDLVTEKQQQGRDGYFAPGNKCSGFTKNCHLV